jgi:RNA polymerase sigma factor (TIGR02999 family)
MKLAGGSGSELESELHFRRRAACVMRQVVRDAARRRRANKRGGGAILVTLDDSVDLLVSTEEDFLRLDAALDLLGEVSPRQDELVVLRFFGGLSNAEIESALGVSERTVERDWKAAKAWLAVEIRRGGIAKKV